MAHEAQREFAYPGAKVFDAITRAIPLISKMSIKSADPAPGYGNKLPTVLRSVGLTDIDAEGSVLVHPAPDEADVLLPLFDRMREPVIAAGGASVDDFSEVIAAINDERPALTVQSPMLVSTRGRRAA